jgi:tetratricopeptide (TPR) repeat protein
MLFNLLDINARYCVRGMYALMLPATAIAMCLTPGLQSNQPVRTTIQSQAIDAAAILQKAEAFKAAKNYQRALPLFDQYIGLVDDNPEAFADKAYCLNGMHNYKEALKVAKSGLALDDECVDALSNASWALNNLGRYQEGLELAQTALDLDPTDPESWCDEGEALMGLGDYKSALVAFNKHCGLHNDEWFAYDRRAACYDKLGMHDLAAADRKKMSSL